jgi:hypothetical protein
MGQKVIDMPVPFDAMLKELFTPSERAAIRRTGMAIAVRNAKQVKSKPKKRASIGNRVHRKSK